MNTKKFACGEVIFEQGTYASTMYEIASGAVGIYTGYGTSEQHQLIKLGPGETFGEMGLAECYPRSATAVSLKDGTTVDEISAEELAEFFNDRPDKVLGIMRQMSARLRDTDKKYAEACRTVYEAIEVERAQTARQGSLRSRLSGMLGHFRRSGASK